MSSLPLILNPVPESEWPKLTSEARGIAYALKHCGWQAKAVALEAGIDPAVLSKAQTGAARLSDEDMDRFMDVTRCEAPLYARMLLRGYDPRSLRKLETETERALREANEALEAERVKVRVLTDALRGSTR
jgi:hypothetical protein